MKKIHKVPDEYIVVDFETTKVDRFSRHRISEIIEIGAVKVQRDKITERFKTYVCPVIEKINKADTDLCGIKYSDVLKAPKFKEAIKMFSDFSENLPIYSWGDRDKKFVKNNKRLLFVEEGRSDFIDAQRIFIDTLKKNGVEINLPSVTNAMIYVGEEFSGTAHDALTDAENTANIIMKM